MMFQRQSSFDALHRLLAVGSAVLVFALGLMSASPALHEWMHAATGEHACDSAPGKSESQPLNPDHGCAVVWFAHGLTVALESVVPDRAPEVRGAEQFRAFAELLVSRTSHRLPPGRAPPQV